MITKKLTAVVNLPQWIIENKLKEVVFSDETTLVSQKINLQGKRIEVRPLHGAGYQFCQSGNGYDGYGWKKEWLTDFMEEEEVDWSKVPVDTKVFVKLDKSCKEEPRYFSYYDAEKHKIVCFANGATKWSTTGELTEWSIGRLAKEGE